MKDFQRMYKALNVNPGETKTLIISRTEAVNNKFAFVFSGVDRSDVINHAKILITAGAEDKKIDLVQCGSRVLACGFHACILVVDYPIMSDIEIILIGQQRSGVISLGVHAGND